MKILLEKVRQKVNKLMDSHNRLIEENQMLIDEKKNLLKEISLLKSDISHLNNRVNEISISNSFQHNESDNRLARKKVNMFLREIDKCIALLNN